MKFAVLLTLVAVGCVETLLANGGGYSRGGVSHTGSVTGFEPEGTERVRILDEQLTIKLGKDEAKVEVRYILKNTGKGTTVRFGFPVEELEGVDMMDEPTKPKKQQVKPEYCRDYQIEAGGKAIGFKFEPELTGKQSEERPEAELDAMAILKQDLRRVGLKGWLISKVSFDAEEEKTMTIRYRSEYPFGLVSVSDEGAIQGRTFNYRLSTGACWQGPIERGRVVIEPEGVHPSDITVLKPVNRFHKEDSRWVWEFTDLEPTLADDIEVEAVPVVNFYGHRTPSGDHHEGNGPVVNFIDRKGVWYIVHSNYSITASSTLPPSGDKSYSPENLRIGNYAAWSEGAPGPGLDEWLELKAEVPQPLRSIGMVPGYSDGGDDLFRANARPKRVEVTINDEFTFESQLADRSESQDIPVIGYTKPVKKVRLTFKQIYPGDKYEDLCVSQITLESKLKKEPHLAPTR